jgi:hypothetical protein
MMLVRLLYIVDFFFTWMALVTCDLENFFKNLWSYEHNPPSYVVQFECTFLLHTAATCLYYLAFAAFNEIVGEFNKVAIVNGLLPSITISGLGLFVICGT